MPDFHPDPFYKPFSSGDDACHRGSGSTGPYGAETTDCDSPFVLVNATFDWIDANLKDSIDFIVWTGDSARHDLDDQVPRTRDQVLGLNKMLVTKFVEVFGKDDKSHDDDPNNDMIIPIVPTFGNNDVVPHNILDKGPNFWTKQFSRIWKKFIPEEQRHTFERGGWFSVEVIPHQLAVFSLNTMYFFDSNSAVDGCSQKSEPGYEHMEWLRIQLQRLRERGMKAIITGHVPPARTDRKQLWDETCWQKYALWMRQYRDVVVGSMYGHMNIDHFMLQDFKNIEKKTLKGKNVYGGTVRETLENEVTTAKKAKYLTDLRLGWSEIPIPPSSKTLMDSCKAAASGIFDNVFKEKKKSKKSKKEKYLDEIGGHWGESYSLSLVSASVVPNYFPSMRIIEYNISGVDSHSVSSKAQRLPDTLSADRMPLDEEAVTIVHTPPNDLSASKKKKKGKKHKKAKFAIPDPPSKSAPPGPAYSPQTFSWLGYTQYYANLTQINNLPSGNKVNDLTQNQPQMESKYERKSKPNPKEFKYEIEYNTRNDSIWCLPDLTVRSYLDLARVIGRFEPSSAFHATDDHIEVNDVEADDEQEEDEDENTSDPVHTSTKKNKKKKKNHHHKGKDKKRRDANRAWFTFVRRAFVGAVEDDDLREEFGIV